MKENDEFDYVIVGAGSAGCVLANRLSECGKYRICLLAAGGSDSHPITSFREGKGVDHCASAHEPAGETRRERSSQILL